MAGKYFPMDIKHGASAAEQPGTAVTIGTTATAVLAANGNRAGAVLINDSDEVIYLKLGTVAVSPAVLNEGIRLNAAGGSFTIDQNFLYTGAINAISTNGSKKLLVTEL